MNHMSKDTLNGRIVPLLLSLIVGLGTFFSLWPPAGLNLAADYNYAQVLMFILLGIGSLFFLLGNNKLMVISIIGCAFICYELNDRTQSAFKPALTKHQELIRIGIFNLYPDFAKLDESLEAMCFSNTDLISIKAIPNPQFAKIKEQLGLCGYNFHRCLGEKDAVLFKEVVFSKQAFAHIDTLYLPQSSDYGQILSKNTTGESYLPKQVFHSGELKYLKFEPVNYQSDQRPLGIIQTYQFIHQAPGMHDKKTPKKL